MIRGEGGGRIEDGVDGEGEMVKGERGLREIERETTSRGCEDIDKCGGRKEGGTRRTQYDKVRCETDPIARAGSNRKTNGNHGYHNKSMLIPLLTPCTQAAALITSNRNKCNITCKYLVTYLYQGLVGVELVCACRS